MASRAINNVATSVSDGSMFIHANEATGTLADEQDVNPLRKLPSVRAIAQRRAARLNASSIDQREVEKLLEERGQLLHKKFSGGLEAHEERRLNFVRWSLDRVQDARHGHVLDDLETAVEMYERLGADIDRLLRQLQENVMNNRRR